MLRAVVSVLQRNFARGLTQEQLFEKYGIGKQNLDYTDIISRHRTNVEIEGVAPSYRHNFVAPSATIVGNVELWEHASVWYNAVIRGDSNLVRIGIRTNIQDGTVITPSPVALDLTHDGSTIIGHRVTVGHNCKLHACTVEDACHIGMGSILMDGSYMCAQSMLGARTVLYPGTKVPSGQLWCGNPGKYVRDLTEEEKEWIEHASLHYVKTANRHKDEFYLENPMELYLQAQRNGIKVGYTIEDLPKRYE